MREQYHKWLTQFPPAAGRIYTHSFWGGHTWTGALFRITVVQLIIWPNLPDFSKKMVAKHICEGRGNSLDNMTLAVANTFNKPKSPIDEIVVWDLHFRRQGPKPDIGKSGDQFVFLVMGEASGCVCRYFPQSVTAFTGQYLGAQNAVAVLSKVNPHEDWMIKSRQPEESIGLPPPFNLILAKTCFLKYPKKLVIRVQIQRCVALYFVENRRCQLQLEHHLSLHSGRDNDPRDPSVYKPSKFRRDRIGLRWQTLNENIPILIGHDVDRFSTRHLNLSARN